MNKILFMILITFPLNFIYGQHTLKWSVGYSENANVTPDEFIPATVPGAVQLDFAKEKKYGLFYYAENWKDYLWMEDLYYTYKTTFKKPDLTSQQRLFFISKGIDYEFDVFINNQLILSQEGMFTWVRLDLTDQLQEKNELKIIVHPVPKSNPFPDRTQANHSVKPAVSYLWDWHPRLIPLGIWDETYLEIQQNPHINDVAIDYSLNDESALKTPFFQITEKRSFAGKM